MLLSIVKKCIKGLIKHRFVSCLNRIFLSLMNHYNCFHSEEDWIVNYGLQRDFSHVFYRLFKLYVIFVRSQKYY